MRLPILPTVPHIWRVVLTILFALTIPALSLLPSPFFAEVTPSIVGRFPMADKEVHVILYSILTGLTIWTATAASVAPVSRRRFFFLAGAATAYGLLMEWFQGFTATRSCDLGDGLANASGAFLMAEAGFRLIRRSARSGR